MKRIVIHNAWYRAKGFDELNGEDWRRLREQFQGTIANGRAFVEAWRNVLACSGS
jgi:hypothetical protein